MRVGKLNGFHLDGINPAPNGMGMPSAILLVKDNGAASVADLAWRAMVRNFERYVARNKFGSAAMQKTMMAELLLLTSRSLRKTRGGSTPLPFSAWAPAGTFIRKCVCRCKISRLIKTELERDGFDWAATNDHIIAVLPTQNLRLPSELKRI